jgi:hypothetical protein
MTSLFRNARVYAIVCLLFGLAILASALTGGSIPTFAAGLVPNPVSHELASSPVPPPDPGTPPAQLASSPVPPPDPGTPPAQLASSPVPPPDPGTPPAQLASSPVPPPDPGTPPVKKG